MKIALVTDTYVPAPNGTSISVETIRRSLSKLGHDVWIFAPEYKSLKIKEEKIVTMPGIYSVSDRFKPKVWPTNSPKDKVIEEAKFDIVHSHHFYSPFKYSLDFARSSGAKHIASFYRLFPEYENKKSTLSFTSPERKSIKKLLDVANNCDHVAALSKGEKKYLEEIGVSSPIGVTPVGVFTKDYASYPPQAVREKFKIPKNRQIILYVARLEEDAALELLLKSFKIIWKTIDDVHLLIIGGGSKEEELKKLISHQGFANYVTVAGFLPKSQVNKIYGATDIFAYPKTLDPQPLCILEALSSGAPVVAVEGYGAPDFVKHNQNGLIRKNDVDDFAKGIIEVLRRKQLMLEFKRNARMHAIELRASNMIHFLLRLYESVLHEKSEKMF